MLSNPSKRVALDILGELRIYKVPFDYEPEFQQAALERAGRLSVNLHYTVRTGTPKKYVRIKVSGTPEDVERFITETNNDTLLFDSSSL